MQARQLSLALLLSLQAVSVAAEEALPSAELLEFIGEWEGGDGEWIDPDVLSQVALSDETEEKEVQGDE